jgi:hypothetical protein
MTSNNNLLSDANALIVNKLSSYPEDVRELALQAILLSENYPEVAVAEQLQSLVRKLSRQQEGGSQ